MGFEQLRGTRSWDYVCALQQSRHGDPQCCLQLSERLSQGRGTGYAMRPHGQDLRPGTELLGRKRRLLKREAGRSSGLSFHR